MRIACLLLLCGCLLLAAEPDVLPGTAHWSFPADVSAEQYGELERYLDTEIQSVLNNRRTAADPGAARLGSYPRFTRVAWWRISEMAQKEKQRKTRIDATF